MTINTRRAIAEFFDRLPEMMERIGKRWSPAHVAFLKRPAPLIDVGESIFANSPPGMLVTGDVPYWEAPLPFPTCWMHVCYPHPDPAAALVLGTTSTPIHHMIRVDPVGDGRAMLTHFGRGASVLAKIGNRRDPWSFHFLARALWRPGEQSFAVQASGEESPRDNMMSNFDMPLFAADLEPVLTRDEITASIAATLAKTVLFTAYSSWLLAQPKSVAVEEFAVADNRLRRGRNLLPIPPARRILHVNFRTLRRLPSGNHTGVEKAPHDRRAHFRKLYDGRVVPVRAARIKGGAEVPRIYELHHDFPGVST